MKRLNEWKQRMLQSPLTRKSSRAQTPVSPKLVQNSKVTRKGSNASKTSRTRSLSKLSNRLSSTSSSDEGKNKVPYHTKEQKRNENGIETFRFSFFLLYKDLDFCQFKVFYT